jgi:hypothetical protein
MAQGSTTTTTAAGRTSTTDKPTWLQRFWKNILTSPWHWSAFLISHVAGFVIAPVFIGGIIGNIFGVFPAWVATAFYALSYLVQGLDVVYDGKPDARATWLGVITPSVALKVHSVFGNGLNSWGNDIRIWLEHNVGHYIGAMPMVAVGVVLIVITWLIRRKLRNDAGKNVLRPSFGLAGRAG